MHDDGVASHAGRVWTVASGVWYVGAVAPTEMEKRFHGRSSSKGRLVSLCKNPCHSLQAWLGSVCVYRREGYDEHTFTTVTSS